MDNKKDLIFFEHQKVYHNRGESRISEKLYEQLVAYHKDGSPYFKLLHNGVQFCEYVGVLKVGNTTIEVLPKADNNNEEGVWRNLLIQMIKEVSGFKVKNTSEASLKVNKHTLLDVYFEIFISELEYLLHRGLIKRYKKTEGNKLALKGALQFSKQISQNLIHKERFFVKYTHYQVDHTIHQILFKALKVLNQLNTNATFKSRIGALLLNFPVVKGIKVNATTFEKLVYDRKNEHYEKALQVAEMILMNYHPDVTKGRKEVLALMFDMNVLWEKFIYTVLRKNLKEHHVKTNISKNFWKANEGSSSSLRPDIVLEHKLNKTKVVLDTKWKNIGNSNPSISDLRQMYTYHHYYDATKVALVYPGGENSNLEGEYYHTGNIDQLSGKNCSVIQIATSETYENWKQEIIKSVVGFCDRD